MASILETYIQDLNSLRSDRKPYDKVKAAMSDDYYLSHIPLFRANAFDENGKKSAEFTCMLLRGVRGRDFAISKSRWPKDTSSDATTKMTTVIQSKIGLGEISMNGLVREFDLIMGNLLNQTRKYLTREEQRFLPKVVLKKDTSPGATLYVTVDPRLRKYVIAYNPQFILFDLLPSYLCSYSNGGDSDKDIPITIPEAIGAYTPMDILVSLIAFVVKHEMAHVMFQHLQSDRTVTTVQKDIDNHSLANMIEDSYINNWIISNWIKQTSGSKRNINFGLNGILSEFHVSGYPSDMLLAYLKTLCGSGTPVVYPNIFEDMLRPAIPAIDAFVRSTAITDDPDPAGRDGQEIYEFVQKPGRVELNVCPNGLIAMTEKAFGMTPSSKAYIHLCKQIMSCFIDNKKAIKYKSSELGRGTSEGTTRRKPNLKPGMLVRVKSDHSLGSVVSVDAKGVYHIQTVDQQALGKVIDAILDAARKDPSYAAILDEMKKGPNVPETLGLSAWPTTGEESDHPRNEIKPVALETLFPYNPSILANATPAENPPKLSDVLRDSGMSEDEIKRVAKEMQEQADELAQQNAGMGGGEQEDKDGQTPPFVNDLASPDDDTERLNTHASSGGGGNDDSDDDDSQGSQPPGQSSQQPGNSGGDNEGGEGQEPPPSDQPPTGGKQGKNGDRDQEQSTSTGEEGTEGGGEELDIGDQDHEGAGTGEEGGDEELDIGDQDHGGTGAGEEGGDDEESSTGGEPGDDEDEPEGDYTGGGSGDDPDDGEELDTKDGSDGGSDDGEEPDDSDELDTGDDDDSDGLDIDEEPGEPGDEEPFDEEPEDEGGDSNGGDGDGKGFSDGGGRGKPGTGTGTPEDDVDGVEPFDMDDPFLSTAQIGAGDAQLNRDIMQEILDQIKSAGGGDIADAISNVDLDNIEVSETGDASANRGGSGDGGVNLNSVQMVSDKNLLFRMLSKMIQKASGIREIFDPSTPSRKVVGMYGKDIETPTIKEMAILLDISGSMGTPKFRAVFSQLVAVSERFRIFKTTRVHLICWDDGTPLHYKYYGLNDTTLRQMMIDGNKQRGGTVAETGWLGMAKVVSKPELVLFCSDGGFGWNNYGGANSIIQRFRNKTIHIIVDDSKESFVSMAPRGVAAMDPMFYKRIILVNSSMAKKM